jgi:hypothetical protein
MRKIALLTLSIASASLTGSIATASASNPPSVSWSFVRASIQVGTKPVVNVCRGSTPRADSAFDIQFELGMGNWFTEATSSFGNQQCKSVTLTATAFPAGNYSFRVRTGIPGAVHSVSSIRPLRVWSPLGGSFGGFTRLTDSQGYTFNVDVSAVFPHAIANITNAPPGKTDVIVDATGQVTITNTTPGRNAPTASDFGNLLIGEVVPSKSVLCTALISSKIRIESGPLAGSYCWIQLAEGSDPPDNLGSGLTTRSIISVSGAGALGPARLDEFPTTEADEVIRQLNNSPTLFTVGVAIAGSTFVPNRCTFDAYNTTGDVSLEVFYMSLMAVQPCSS